MTAQNKPPVTAIYKDTNSYQVLVGDTTVADIPLAYIQSFVQVLSPEEFAGFLSKGFQKAYDGRNVPAIVDQHPGTFTFTTRDYRQGGKKIKETATDHFADVSLKSALAPYNDDGIKNAVEAYIKAHPQAELPKAEPRVQPIEVPAITQG